MSAEVATTVASTPEAAPNAGASNQPASQPGGAFRIKGTTPNVDAVAKMLGQSMVEKAQAAPEEGQQAPDPEPATQVAESAVTDAAQDGSQAQPQAQAPEQVDDVEVPDDFEPAATLSESLRRLNSDVRRTVKGALYRDQEYKRLGFTVEHARYLSNAGLTPERATKLLQRLPTEADDDRVFGAAEAANRIESDFRSNPRQLLYNLAQVDPGAFRNLLSEAATAHERINPQVSTRRTVDTARQLITTLKSRGAKANNEALVAAAQILEEDMFGAGGLSQEPQQQIPPEFAEELDRTRQELARHREERDRMYQTQVAGFNNWVVNTTADQLTAHVRSLVDDSRIALDEDEKTRWVKSVVEETRNDFINNPDLVSAFQGVLGRGGYDQQHGKNAVAFALDRAKRLALPHFNDGLKRYRKLVGTKQPASPPAQQQPRTPPSVPSTITGPAKPANPLQSQRTVLPRGNRPDVDKHFEGFQAVMMKKLGL